LAAPEESPLQATSLNSPSQPSAIEFTIGAVIARAEIPALSERARRLMEGVDADRLICDVGAITNPDAVTVDALARLQLTARRLGRHVRLEHASPQLRELLAFVGLSEVLPLSGQSGPQPRGQTEEREEGGGVEEEGDPADHPT
jgi:ABC-type transporter Mla MlaB component